MLLLLLLFLLLLLLLLFLDVVATVVVSSGVAIVIVASVVLGTAVVSVVAPLVLSVDMLVKGGQAHHNLVRLLLVNLSDNNDSVLKLGSNSGSP